MSRRQMALKLIVCEILVSAVLAASRAGNWAVLRDNFHFLLSMLREPIHQ